MKNPIEPHQIPWKSHVPWQTDLRLAANVHIPRRQRRVHRDEAAVASHELHQTNAVGLGFTQTPWDPWTKSS